MSRGTILIVEDNPLNSGILAGILRDREYTVHLASDGPTGLRVIKEKPPELVLLDIRMEGMDGYEVCRRIKAEPTTADIPVIFVSALDEALDKVKAFHVGGADYVTKPFPAFEVIARVQNHLKIARLQKQLIVKNAELERANRMLQAMSYIDPLTGIANRRHFEEFLDQEWRRARRDNTPLALVMVDVDHFKQFNDTYGHRSGDDCLKYVATEISGALHRGGDLAARYGGEEFVVVLPGTELPGALVVAEEMRSRVERLRILHKASPHRVVTVSLGLACLRAGESDASDVLVNAADRALYRSKEAGRNRVTQA
jgi:diguanylate cyclase (GGDEF)-like protein